MSPVDDNFLSTSVIQIIFIQNYDDCFLYDWNSEIPKFPTFQDTQPKHDPNETLMNINSSFKFTMKSIRVIKKCKCCFSLLKLTT